MLAVDNLSGATVAGRKIRVEHVDNYKKRKAEVGSAAQRRACGAGRGRLAPAPPRLPLPAAARQGHASSGRQAGARM